MRFALALVLALVPAVASADENPLLEPYAPFKLIAVMPDTQQALLWDENAAEYRLAKVGEDLDGWRLSGLDVRGPRVALQKEDLIDELELVRLPRPGSVITFKDSRAALPAPLTSAPAVMMPDTTPPASSGTTTITTVPLTPVPDANPAPAPAPAPTPTATRIAPTEIRATPAPPPPPPPPVEETRAVTRAEFDREINDFDKLMASVMVEPADGGGFTIVELEPRSWIHHLGFRKGDVVRRIAGESISTIEDAARVYGRLRGMSSVTAEIERGDRQVNLRIDIQ
jgi:hypothetical protein